MLPQSLCSTSNAVSGGVSAREGGTVTSSNVKGTAEEKGGVQGVKGQRVLSMTHPGAGLLCFRPRLSEQKGSINAEQKGSMNAGAASKQQQQQRRVLVQQVGAVCCEKVVLLPFLFFFHAALFMHHSAYASLTGELNTAFLIAQRTMHSDDKRFPVNSNTLSIYLFSGGRGACRAFGGWIEWDRLLRAAAVASY